MTTVERATVAVCGLLLASIFGVLLAWVMAVGVGTDDRKSASTEKKPGAPAEEKIEILKARPVPITPPWPHVMRPRDAT
jgi:hypothetical protein